MLDNKYVRTNVTRTNVLKQMHKNKFVRKKNLFYKNPTVNRMRGREDQSVVLLTVLAMVLVQSVSFKAEMKRN